MGIHPTIIIFNEESRQKVIGAFISLLEKHQITDPDGTYKIVGWVKSETTKGLKIGDYWDGYQADTGALAETKYWSMIDAMCDELRGGRIYKVGYKKTMLVLLPVSPKKAIALLDKRLIAYSVDTIQMPLFSIDDESLIDTFNMVAFRVQCNEGEGYVVANEEGVLNELKNKYNKG